MSRFPEVVVNVGAVAAVHFTVPGQVTVKDPAPLWITVTVTNDPAGGGLLKVSVALPVMVNSRVTFAPTLELKFSVCAPEPETVSYRLRAPPMEFHFEFK